MRHTVFGHMELLREHHVVLSLDSASVLSFSILETALLKRFISLLFEVMYDSIVRHQLLCGVAFDQSEP